MADDKTPYHERYKAAPPPDYMRYLTAPFEGYWKRQGNLAREGLAMAEDGARRTRGGDLSGYLGQFLGPLAYVSSPINALIPTEQEAYAAFDGDAAPFAAGVLGAASFGLPGPKVKGLGKGLGGLADDVTDAERAALSSRLQAEAGQTGGQASSATRDQALANLTEAPQGITAYHGSPHTFDKFSMDKIGTGEGAQAYGHGLYFAENEKVAQGYRDTLSYMAPKPSDTAHVHAARSFIESGHDDASTIVGMKKAYPTATEADIRAAIGEVKGHDKGSTYQVRLNVKPDELLDWDRPLSEQPHLHDALKKAGVDGSQVGDASNAAGSKIKRAISNKLYAADLFKSGEGELDITSAGVSERFKAAGIKGVRYQDQGSRGTEGGTYNYVIFDDKLVDILKRYAIPFTLGAGGAAIVSGANMPPELAAQMGPEA